MHINTRALAQNVNTIKVYTTTTVELVIFTYFSVFMMVIWWLYRTIDNADVTCECCGEQYNTNETDEERKVQKDCQIISCIFGEEEADLYSKILNERKQNKENLEKVFYRIYPDGKKKTPKDGMRKTSSEIIDRKNIPLTEITTSSAVSFVNLPAEYSNSRETIVLKDCNSLISNESGTDILVGANGKTHRNTQRSRIDISKISSMKTLIDSQNYMDETGMIYRHNKAGVRREAFSRIRKLFSSTEKTPSDHSLVEYLPKSSSSSSKIDAANRQCYGKRREHYKRIKLNKYSILLDKHDYNKEVLNRLGMKKFMEAYDTLFKMERQKIEVLLTPNDDGIQESSASSLGDEEHYEKDSVNRKTKEKKYETFSAQFPPPMRTASAPNLMRRVPMESKRNKTLKKSTITVKDNDSERRKKVKIAIQPSNLHLETSAINLLNSVMSKTDIFKTTRRLSVKRLLRSSITDLIQNEEHMRSLLNNNGKIEMKKNRNEICRELNFTKEDLERLLNRDSKASRSEESINEFPVEDLIGVGSYPDETNSQDLMVYGMECVDEDDMIAPCTVDNDVESNNNKHPMEEENEIPDLEKDVNIANTKNKRQVPEEITDFNFDNLSEETHSSDAEDNVHHDSRKPNYNVYTNVTETIKDVVEDFKCPKSEPVGSIFDILAISDKKLEHRDSVTIMRNTFQHKEDCGAENINIYTQDKANISAQQVSLEKLAKIKNYETIEDDVEEFKCPKKKPVDTLFDIPPASGRKLEPKDSALLRKTFHQKENCGAENISIYTQDKANISVRQVPFEELAKKKNTVKIKRIDVTKQKGVKNSLKVSVTQLPVAERKSFVITKERSVLNRHPDWALPEVFNTGFEGDEYNYALPKTDKVSQRGRTPLTKYLRKCPRLQVLSARPRVIYPPKLDTIQEEQPKRTSH